MIDAFYPYLYYGSMSVLAVLAFAYLLRTIIGPTFFDRILAVNNISTLVIIMISILAVQQGESYIVDVALIYSMLGFITVLIVCKAYLRTHNRNPASDFAHLKSSEKTEKEEALL